MIAGIAGIARNRKNKISTRSQPPQQAKIGLAGDPGRGDAEKTDREFERAESTTGTTEAAVVQDYLLCWPEVIGRKNKVGKKRPGK